MQSGVRVHIFSSSSKNKYDSIGYLGPLSDLPLWVLLFFQVNSKSPLMILKDCTEESNLPGSTRLLERLQIDTSGSPIRGIPQSHYGLKCVFIMFVRVCSCGPGAHKELICCKLINLHIKDVINVDAGEMAWDTNPESGPNRNS